MFPPGSFRTFFPSACLSRWPLLAFALLVALTALFAARPAFAAGGDHLSSLDFNLAASNDIGNGITLKDTQFYVVDTTDHRAYAYTSNGSYSVSASFDLALGFPSYQGITWNGSTFFAVDSFNEQMRTYSSNGVAGSVWNLASGNTNATGVIWDGPYLYVVDTIDDKAYAYTSNGTYTPGADWNLAANNGQPRGITSDGTDFYVVDDGDDKVYVYTSNGTHIPDADFSLTTNNGDPTGIASVGSNLYVLDVRDNKVYAYEGPNVDPAQTDATLSALSLSSGTLSPAFSSSEQTYTATVPNSATSVTVSATPTRSGASATGTGARALNVGTNALDVVVTAANGVSTRTYRITVAREGMPNAVMFDQSGVLTTPSGIVVDSSLSNADCLLFPDDQQVVFSVFNEEAKPVGVCWATTGTRYLYFLFPEDTPDFTTNIKSEISFTADFQEGTSSSYKLSETNGFLLHNSTSSTMTVSSTTYDYARSDALTLDSGAPSDLSTGDTVALKLEITDDRTVDDFASNTDSHIPEAPMELPGQPQLRLRRGHRIVGPGRARHRIPARARSGHHRAGRAERNHAVRGHDAVPGRRHHLGRRLV